MDGEENGSHIATAMLPASHTVVLRSPMSEMMLLYCLLPFSSLAKQDLHA